METFKWSDLADHLGLSLIDTDHKWFGEKICVTNYYTFPPETANTLFEFYREYKSNLDKLCSLTKTDGEWKLVEKQYYGRTNEQGNIPPEFSDAVEKHHARYPSMDVDRFITWIKNQKISYEYLKIAKIPILNKKMHTHLNFPNYMDMVERKEGMSHFRKHNTNLELDLKR